MAQGSDDFDSPWNALYHIAYLIAEDGTLSALPA